MRTPITPEAQANADLLGENNRQRYLARKRQAVRRAGAGSADKPPLVEPWRATSTRSSAVRRGLTATPPVRQPVRTAGNSLPSGPAPSFTGIALSLVILVAAAGVIGVGLAIYGVHRVMGKVSGVQP